MSAPADRFVPLGRITGVHGVRGWVKLHSFTEPRANLLAYTHWWLTTAGDERRVDIEAGRESGRRLIAKLAGIEDRDTAEALVGAGISVRRSEMPALPAGQYYWADLEGLAVVGSDGRQFGTVERLLATGANDVLVLAGDPERLIPFVVGDTVREVALDRSEIVVDWDESYWD